MESLIFSIVLLVVQMALAAHRPSGIAFAVICVCIVPILIELNEICAAAKAEEGK